MMELAYFQNIRYNILKELLNAEENIKIAVCWFTNQDIFNVICEKVQKGIIVELIIINDYINNRIDGLDFQYFINIGGHFYFGNNDKPMHNKYCIIDNKVLINGSYNWTYFAEYKNEENIIIYKNNELLINLFVSDYERIKSGLLKIEKINKNTFVEIIDTNLLGTHHYLAQDYLYLAIETKNPTIVEKAFNLAPANIEIQKRAVEFNLCAKRKTIMPIGEDVFNNGFTILIPENTEIPSNGQAYFTTTLDNQVSTVVTIRFGRSTNATSNILIGSFNIGGIPPMKKGEPKLKTKWKIDLQGILTVTELIKETNNSVTMKYDINKLLKKIDITD